MVRKQHKFGYFKKFAFVRLEESLKQQFLLFSQIIDNKKSVTEPTDELSHCIFSWKWKDFTARRKLTNFVWVDILLKAEEHHLHQYKFQKDLLELQTFLQKIFDGLLANIEDDSFDIYHNVEKHIEESKNVLNTANHIENDFFENQKELKHLLYMETFLINAKRKSEDRLLKTYLKNRIWNSHIWDAVEARYQINWFRNDVKQNQYLCDATVKKYENDVLHCKEKLEEEKFINRNCMDYFYLSIEKYKNRIIEVQNKFGRELERLDNKLLDIKLQTDKLREQQEWLSKEVQRFNEEEGKLNAQNEVEKYKMEQQNQKKLIANELLAREKTRKAAKKKRR